MNLAAKRTERKKCAGQVLTEYVFMLVTCAVFAVMFFILLAAFSEYGARLIGLISWEPNPPSRSQLESIIKGKL
ncbi:MAG: hypothetical protein J5806_11720 [Lentisphaeria bacterium]|nr:hypothetical protein [Lentisphaeria bacterium]